jgi:hypothetical protein
LNPHWRYGFIENLDTVRHIRLGRWWGVTVSVTPVIWLGPLLFFGLGLALTLAGPPSSLPQRFYAAALFTVAVELATVIHAVGHILGGHLVDHPMDELLMTATRGVNLYTGDQSRLPAHVHLGRAMGGPVLNLVAGGLLAWGLAGAGGWPADLAARAASTNLFFGAGAWLPVPSVDGWVIWREILRLLRPRTP